MHSLLVLIAALPAAVTIEYPGGSLKRLVSELSAAARMDLRVEQSIADKVVVLRSDDRPVEEVLGKLAWAVDGKWIRSGQVRTLVADREALAKESARKRADFAQSIQKKLDEFRAEEKPFDRDAARNLKRELDNPNERRVRSDAEALAASQRIERLTRQIPGTRALYRLLDLIGAQALAEIPEWSSQAWGTKTGRLVKPLPAGWRKIIDALAAEQSVWAGAYSAPADEQMRAFRWARPVDEPIVHVLIEVRRGGQQYWAPRLYAATGNGSVIVSSYADFFAWRNLWSLGTWEKALAEAKYDFDVGAAGLHLVGSGGWKRSSAPDPVVLKTLLFPEQNDPVGLAAGPLLIEAAKRQERSYVGRVGDYLAVPFAAFAKDGLFAPELLRLTASRSFDYQSETDDHWIAMRPRSAYYDADDQVSRRNLGILVREIVRTGRVDYSLYGKMIADLQANDSPLALDYVRAVAPPARPLLYSSGRAQLVAAVRAHAGCSSCGPRVGSDDPDFAVESGRDSGTGEDRLPRWRRALHRRSTGGLGGQHRPDRHRAPLPLPRRPPVHHATTGPGDREAEPARACGRVPVLQNHGCFRHRARHCEGCPAEAG